MHYGYLNDDRPVIVTRLTVDGRTITNPKPETLKNAGYKEIRYTSQPVAEPGFYFSPEWRETEGAIEQIWAKKELPQSDEPWEAFERIMMNE